MEPADRAADGGLCRLTLRQLTLRRLTLRRQVPESPGTSEGLDISGPRKDRFLGPRDA